jgi:hypothetical protein
LNIDEARKKATDHIRGKFSPKSVKIRTAGFSGSPNQIVVKGELEDKDGALNDFEVTINASTGDTLQSLRRIRGTHRVLLELLKNRFGARLEAVIVSKDGTKAFVIIDGMQQAEERRMERINSYDVEFHGPDTAKPDFVSAWTWTETEVVYDRSYWKGRLELWV